MKSLALVLFVLLFSLNSIGQEVHKISVFFDFNSEVLAVEEEAKLDLLKFNEAERVTLTKMASYTDRSGPNLYNQKLAKRRLESVVAYLRVLEQPSEKDVIGEEYKTKVYVARKFRKVDIYYTLTPYDDETLEEINAPSAIVIKQQASTLINEFSEFIKDSVSSETTIALSVLFHGNSDAFIDPEDPDLWRLFDIMHYNENIIAEIRGHVCCGSAMGLSTVRAYAVYKFLTERSISPDRLKYKGYNNTLPAVTPELTENDRKKNRRVDVVFHKVN